MSALPRQKWTPESYLAFERARDTKHEYFEGEVYAMAGATRKHIKISGNAFAALHAQLRTRPCEIYQSEMRVKIDSAGHYTYPDVVIVCDEPLFEDDEVDTLLNPTVIIEVLSPSTASYDRGLKFQSYRTLKSLREYVLISQDRIHIEHDVRQGEQWILTDVKNRTDTLQLSSVDCSLRLAEVYEKVDLDSDQP